MTKEKMEEFGHMLRFITPLLLTVILFIGGSLMNSQKEVASHITQIDSRLESLAEERMRYLEEYSNYRTSVEQRLTRLENINTRLERIERVLENTVMRSFDSK